MQQEIEELGKKACKDRSQERCMDICYNSNKENGRKVHENTRKKLGRNYAGKQQANKQESMQNMQQGSRK